MPDDFGSGIIVPLIKDKSGNMNDIHNYRPITLTPVISKVLGHVILYVCKENFITDDLQCGFKKNIGCSDAIFAVKSTVSHLVENGSCVYAAALDLKRKHLTGLIILNCSVHLSILVSLSQSLSKQASLFARSINTKI